MTMMPRALVSFFIAALASHARAEPAATAPPEVWWHTYAAFRNDVFTELDPPIDDLGFTHDNVFSLRRQRGDTTFGELGVADTVMLAASGAITAVPLLMFAGAANRIPMVGLGMVQYVAPTIQLLLGVLAFHEPLPPMRLAGFVLVWLALAIFTWDGLRHARRMARAAAAAAVA